MTSILAFSLSLPLGAGISHLLEERQCFRSADAESIGVYILKRLHGYAVLTWAGFAVFIYILWTRSDGMAMVDPNAASTRHNLVEGIMLGILSGSLLGCGIYGSVLHYQQIRAGDYTEIRNEDLTMQLMNEDPDLVGA